MAWLILRSNATIARHNNEAQKMPIRKKSAPVAHVQQYMESAEPLALLSGLLQEMSLEQLQEAESLLYARLARCQLSIPKRVIWCLEDRFIEIARFRQPTPSWSRPGCWRRRAPSSRDTQARRG